MWFQIREGKLTKGIIINLATATKLVPDRREVWIPPGLTHYELSPSDWDRLMNAIGAREADSH